jgi:hypothetical protein
MFTEKIKKINGVSFFNKYPSDIILSEIRWYNTVTDVSGENVESLNKPIA